MESDLAQKHGVPVSYTHLDVYKRQPQEMAFEFVNAERVMRPEGFSDRLVPIINPLGPQAAP